MIESMTTSPTEIPVPSWAELDILVIITVNDFTRHQFSSIEGSGQILEDGIYIAGARRQDVDPEDLPKEGTHHAIQSMPAVCEMFFAGFDSLEEATEVCDEIYEIRNALPEGQNGVGHAVTIWLTREQDETVH
jgi:hypothetical protein